MGTDPGKPITDRVVECARCDQRLEAKEYKDGTIEVQPCPNCVLKEIEELKDDVRK